MLINIIIFFIFIFFNIYHIFLFWNNECENRFTYSLTFVVFIIIIGIILSFNFSNSIYTKTRLKFFLYCLIIIFITLLDLLRPNIKCIGAVKKTPSNPDEEPVYFFNKSPYYNRFIFILLNINMIFCDNILVYENDSENKSFDKLIKIYNKYKDIKNGTSTFQKFISELFIISGNNLQKLNFKNFNYLFIFVFLITYIPNFIPNIDSVFNSTISFIIFLVYLLYTINNFVGIPNILEKIFGFSDILKTNQFLLCLIIIIIIFILFYKNNFMDTSTEDNPYVDLSKFNNFIYFTIIMFCFLILFLLKNNLFSNPLDKITKFVGLYWHIFLVVFLILFILSFVYYMIKYNLKAVEFTKCTKDNIKQYLMLIIYDDTHYSIFKDDLCKYFNVRNRTQLANKVDSLNFDEDGCFNYEDLKPILDKIKDNNIFTHDENNNVTWFIKNIGFPILIILILTVFLFSLLNILTYIWRPGYKTYFMLVAVSLFLGITYFYTKSITLYNSCEDNKIQCKDKLNRINKCSGIVEIEGKYNEKSCSNTYNEKKNNSDIDEANALKQADTWCTVTNGCTLNTHGCGDKYYKMNFNKTIHSKILWGLLFSLIIIICMFYQNILNTRLLLEKNKIFIIIFVIIIIICSFLLLQNNIIQN